MSKETMLPQLKAGSVVDIKLGSGFIGKIQECFQQHCTGHEQEMQSLKDRNGNYDEKPLTPWENQAIMYSSLLQEVMTVAEKNGMIEYVSMESLMEDITPATPHKNQEEDLNLPD